MSFKISGLPREEFQTLFGLDEAALQKRGVIRLKAEKNPGYPCRITLEDAEQGENILLLNYQSHKALTPYQSSYAIYVREAAERTGEYSDEIPPVMRVRPISLRFFDENAMLVGGDISMNGDLKNRIEQAFENPDVSYIHAHNAIPGCFSAAIERA